MNRNRSTFGTIGTVTAAVLLLTSFGCATKGFVRHQISAAEGEIEDRIAGVRSDVERSNEEVGDLRGDLRTQGQEIETLSADVDAVSQTAKEALDRAIAAGKLAEGKFVAETVLTDDRAGFGFDRADLTDQIRVELSDFAGKLVADNQNLYIEIQGHTDSAGNEAHNLELGEQRAESVRRYLNSEKGVPLHRISVISYGESAPIADNATREGRARNRRVALVVLR